MGVYGFLNHSVLADVVHSGVSSALLEHELKA